MNGKSYYTCNTCRVQNKAVYQRKLTHKQDDNQIEIEFHDFHDFIAQIFDSFENITDNNKKQENNGNLEFKVSCIINIITLKGDSKEKADCIIKTISDVDDYTWMYVIKL